MDIEVLSLEQHSSSNFVAIVKVDEKIERFEYIVSFHMLNNQRLRAISGDNNFSSYARTNGIMTAAMDKLVRKVSDGENLSFPIKLDLE